MESAQVLQSILLSSRYLWHRMTWVGHLDVIVLAIMLASVVLIVLRVSYRLARRKETESNTSELQRDYRRHLEELCIVVNHLKAIASAAPFLGLAGTCLSILSTFRAYSGSPYGLIVMVTSGMAAALVTRDPTAVCHALMTIAAGEAAEDLSLDAFIAQGMDYSVGGSGLERLTKLFQDLGLTHPMPVRRVRLLLDWVHEGEYDPIVRGEYLRVGQEGSVREEADAATAFYGERISAAFQQAGTSISEAGQQLGDWLKKQNKSK